MPRRQHTPAAAAAATTAPLQQQQQRQWAQAACGRAGSKGTACCGCRCRCTKTKAAACECNRVLSYQFSSSTQLQLSALLVCRCNCAVQRCECACGHALGQLRRQPPFRPSQQSMTVVRICGAAPQKVLELLLDRKAADARHAREVSAKEAELNRLQDYIDHELSELQQRQSQVHNAAQLFWWCLHIRIPLCDNGLASLGMPCCHMRALHIASASWLVLGSGDLCHFRVSLSGPAAVGATFLCNVGGGYCAQRAATAAGSTRCTARQPGCLLRDIHAAQTGMPHRLDTTCSLH